MTQNSASSADRIDLEELSLQKHIDRISLAITTAKRLKRTYAMLDHERQNYQRLLVLHREQKAYDRARPVRRRPRKSL